MRESPFRTSFAEKGASFARRCGADVVASVSDRESEYRAIRDAVGVTDFSFMRVYRVPEETGIDFLDGLVAGNVPRIRFGRVLHSFLANPEGSIVADCYVANNDEEFYLLCESLADVAEIDRVLDEHGASEAGLQDLSGTHALLGVDGLQSWAVMRAVFGADVLGLPYLSVETYPFEGVDVLLFRAGKTSEFGYLLLAPLEVAGALFEKTAGEALGRQGGALCGVSVHDDLRLEGRFFNVFAEGAWVGDPLALGLQWMIDFEKPSFIGREAILERRAAGVKKKILGLRTEGPSPDLRPGAQIFCADQVVAEVVATGPSHVLGCTLGLALFPTEIAYSGLGFELGAGGPTVTTISMPPIMPKSLTVKLDEM